MSRQLLWLLNPCHMLSMVQIFSLARPNSRLSHHLAWMQVMVTLLTKFVKDCRNAEHIIQRRHLNRIWFVVSAP